MELCLFSDSILYNAAVLTFISTVLWLISLCCTRPAARLWGLPRIFPLSAFSVTADRQLDVSALQAWYRDPSSSYRRYSAVATLVTLIQSLIWFAFYASLFYDMEHSRSLLSVSTLLSTILVVPYTPAKYAEAWMSSILMAGQGIQYWNDRVHFRFYQCRYVNGKLLTINLVVLAMLDWRRLLTSVTWHIIMTAFEIISTVLISVSVIKLHHTSYIVDTIVRVMYLPAVYYVTFVVLLYIGHDSSMTNDVVLSFDTRALIKITVYVVMLVFVYLLSRKHSQNYRQIDDDDIIRESDGRPKPDIKQSEPAPLGTASL